MVFCAIGFYGQQILVPSGTIEDVDTYLLLGAFVTCMLAAREVGVHLGADWLGAPWTRYVLLATALGCFFAVAMVHVFDFEDATRTVLVFLAALAAALALYRLALPDFGAFAIAVGYGGFFTMALGGRLISETIGYDGDSFVILLSLALLTVWCVAVTAGMGRLLMLLRPRFLEAGG